MDVPTTRAVCFGCNKGAIATGKAIAVADVDGLSHQCDSGTYLTNRQLKARVPGNIEARPSVYGLCISYRS